MAKKHQQKRLIIGAASALILICLTFSLFLITPRNKLPEPTGNYTVSTVEYTLIDPARIETYTTTGEYRKLNIKFWYPETTAGVFPLVVYSHGGLSLKTSNASLFAELASHGYVVCSIDHTYQALWTKDMAGKFAFLNMEYFKELQEEDAKTDKQQSFVYYQKWMDTRMGDLNFVIDSIIKNGNTQNEGVYSLIDFQNIGVMGHSLGGSAALGLPRLRNDIDTVIALESPLLYDITGVNNDQFVLIEKAYPVPVLNIYSDSSWDHLSEWVQYARNYELFYDSESTAFNLHLSGAGHFSLTDLSVSKPGFVRILEGGESVMDNLVYLQNVNKLCLEFFNRYLKNQGEFAGCGLINDQSICETSFSSEK